MNKFFEFFKWLFELDYHELVKVEKDLENIKKSVDDKEETAENQGKEKEEEKTEKNIEKSTDTKDIVENVKNQSADATPSKESENEMAKEYENLKKELAEMKALLEQSKAERAAEKRSAKISSIKDCLDYDVLTSLLDGVEDKDIDSKVEAIKKEKGYLFKKVDTEGFNPATPQNTLSGVEAAFFENNPDLIPSR